MSTPTNADSEYSPHSVTCALCGELADERETAVITDDPMELGGEMPVEYPLRFGAIQKIVAVKGRGEAHMECFEAYLVEYATEKIEGFEDAHDI